MSILDLQGMESVREPNGGGGGGGGGGSTLTILGCGSQTPSNLSALLCH
jgi:Lanthionine-containing peptide SapB precursor RamS